MKFFNNGTVNFPYLSDSMWFLIQHKRWGLMKEPLDCLAIAKQIHRITGLTLPTQGLLLCASREISGPGPERAVVFQNYSLLRWLTARQRRLARC